MPNIEIKNRQNGAIAVLGRMALPVSSDLQPLMEKAVTLVADVLQVEMSKILELKGDRLLLRAGVGWQEGLVGNATVGIDLDSQAGFTLKSDEPVVVKDLRTETRFSGPPLLRDHHVVSGISVIIKTKSQDYGVFGAHTTKLRQFIDDDINFLQAMANIISLAYERKSSEDELKEREEKYRFLADNQPALIWGAGTDKLCNYFNKVWLDFTGRTLEQELSNGWAEGVHPEDIDECVKTYFTAFDKRQPFKMEHRLRSADGSYKWIIDHGLPQFSLSGEFIGYIGTCLDITDSKLTAKALVEQEKKCRIIFEGSHDAIMLLTEKGFFDCNLQTLELFGIQSKSEFSLYHPADLSPPFQPDGRDSLSAASEKIQTALKHGNIRFEWIHRRKDGKDFPAEVSISPFDYEGKKVLQATVRDITALKRAEEALKESNYRWKFALEGAGDGVWDVNLQTSELSLSKRCREMYGFAEGEVLNRLDEWDKYIHPEDKAQKNEICEAYFDGKTSSYVCEYRVLCNDGNWKWILTRGMIVRYDADGRPLRMMGTHQDITERKQRIDAELKQSELRLDTIVSNMVDGVIAINQEGLIELFNHAAERIFGYQAEEVAGKNISLLMPEPHKKKHDQYLQNYLNTGRAKVIGLTLEVRGRRKDGAEFPMTLSVGEMPAGDRRLFVGNVRDITEQKAAFEEITRLRAVLEKENTFLRQEINSEVNSRIIGNSTVIQEVFRKIRMVAPTTSNVLIQGESGTGKELVAQAIHEASTRTERLLIKTNCGGIPRELFESEFFGHVKGAFTGAVDSRVGRFELAHKGTLFLDEISELPLELQTKLLRVIQEGQFEKVGEGVTRQVDVRIIAATNRNLAEEVRAGRFREDLYYRLNVFPIDIPPLRARIEDVDVLARHLIERICRRLNCREISLQPEVYHRLKEYHWPGNVRELQNVLERAAILSQGGRFALDLGLIRNIMEISPVREQDQKPHHQIRRQVAFPVLKAPGDDQETVSSELFLSEDLEEYNIKQYKRQNVLVALEQTNWKISGPRSASEMLRIKPTTLLYRMKKLGIEKPR